MKVAAPLPAVAVIALSGGLLQAQGEPVSPERYPAYLESVLPSPADYQRLHDLTKDNDWIEHRKAASAN